MKRKSAEFKKYEKFNDELKKFILQYRKDNKISMKVMTNISIGALSYQLKELMMEIDAGNAIALLSKIAAEIIERTLVKTSTIQPEINKTLN
jgi:hypothetical protein